MIEAFKYRVPVSYFLKIQGLDLVLGDGANIAGSSQEFCPAMRIRDQAIGHTVETMGVVGSGRALDITLDADTLKLSGYLQQYFSPPTFTTTLNTDQITRTTTTFPVQDASGFAAGGGAVYWGLEKLSYGSTTTGSGTEQLNSVTRDSSGTAFNFAQSSPRGLTGTWAMISDRPLLWTGRLVELWGVATTPEGELLGTPFSTAGMTSGASRLWVGYISEAPIITTTGITLRALPAERLIDKDYGLQRTWETAWKKHPALGNWLEWIFWPSGGAMVLHIVTLDGTLHTSAVDPVNEFKSATVAEDSKYRIIYPYYAWLNARDKWESDLSALTTDTITISFSFWDAPDGFQILKLKVETDGSGDNSLLSACQVEAQGGAMGLWRAVARDTGTSVPHVSDAGVFGQYVTQDYFSPDLSGVASTGGIPIQDPISSPSAHYGGIPSVGQSISWEQSVGDVTKTLVGTIADVIVFLEITGADSLYWLRIQPQDVNMQQGAAALDQQLPTVTEIKGALRIVGADDAEGAAALTLGTLWLKLLCSSGSGSKSTTYDVLPHGWGAGIPEDWVKFTASSFTEGAGIDEFVAYDELDAPAIFLDALAQERSFAQTFVDQIARVDAVPLSRPTAGETPVEITPSDFLADPVSAGILTPPPNVLIFEFLNSSLPKIIHRDALRIAQEGEVNALTLKVPSQWYYEGQDTQTAGVTKIGTVAATVLRGPFFGHVYLFTLSLTSEHWASINVGDALTVTGQHYAWVNLAAVSLPGHRAASISGRVLGKECQLDGSGMSVTLAVWPNAAPQIYSPDSTFTVSSLTITLPAGRVGWFWAEEREDVTFYKPGDEGSKLETKEMQSSTGNTITFSSLPSWVAESGVLITFAPTADASDRQKGWAHVDDGGILL